MHKNFTAFDFKVWWQKYKIQSTEFAILKIRNEIPKRKGIPTTTEALSPNRPCAHCYWLQPLHPQLLHRPALNWEFIRHSATQLPGKLIASKGIHSSLCIFTSNISIRNSNFFVQMFTSQTNSKARLSLHVIFCLITPELSLTPQKPCSAQGLIEGERKKE